MKRLLVVWIFLSGVILAQDTQVKKKGGGFHFTKNKIEWIVRLTPRW